jgi:hypothetical protein
MFQMVRAGFALLFGLGILLRIQAQPLAEAAPAMARSISSLLPRRATVSLEFQALAPVAPAEWSSFRAAIQDELRKGGVEIKESAQPESRLRLALSANPRGLLLIAEVVSNDARQVIMAPWGRPNAGAPRPEMRIQMTPIVEQSEPILDVWMADSGLDLVLLGPNKVTAMHLTNGKWVPNGQATLAVARPTPRDDRGKLQSVGGSFRVFIPGTTCSSPMGSQLLFSCGPTNDSWVLNPGDSPLAAHWVNDRNVLASDSVRQAFYTAAGGWLASSDGKIQNQAGDAVSGTEGWGSDLASVGNPCGPGSVALVTASGDTSGHDQIQAFALASEPPVALSAAIALSGPVTALWRAERSTQATLVTRNLQTGNYEASRLSLACTQ